MVVVGYDLGEILRVFFLDYWPHSGGVDTLLRSEFVQSTWLVRYDSGIVGGVTDLTHLAPLVSLLIVPVLLVVDRAFRLDHRNDLRGKLLFLFQTAVLLIEVIVPSRLVVSILSDGFNYLVQLILGLVVYIVPFILFDRAKNLIMVLFWLRANLVIWKYSWTLEWEVFRSWWQSSAIFDSILLILYNFVD